MGMAKQKYIVIKLGSNLVADQNNRLNRRLLTSYAKAAGQLVEHRYGVILVVSGAVVCGSHIIHPANTTVSKEVAAGVGQAYLTHHIMERFQSRGLKVAQMLLTKSDLSNMKRRHHIQQLLSEGINHKIVFILNENDVLDLNSFSGNDFLAAQVAKLMHADQLLLLSDIDGVYNTAMQIISVFSISSPVPLATLGKGQVKKGVGGIEGKIAAAQDATQAGIRTVVANGTTNNIIARLVLQNEKVGTQFIT